MQCFRRHEIILIMDFCVLEELPNEIQHFIAFIQRTTMKLCLNEVVQYKVLHSLLVTSF